VRDWAEAIVEALVGRHAFSEETEPESIASVAPASGE
jgi:hypothetical protein